MNDEFLTVREAAAVLNRGTTRVRQYIKEGRLAAVWMHGIVWVRRSEVERIPALVRRYERTKGRAGPAAGPKKNAGGKRAGR